MTTLLVCATALSSGCSKEQVSLLGTWTSVAEGETLDFRSDGTMHFTTAEGEVAILRWQADDESLALVAEGGGSRTLRYEIEDDVLTLKYPDEQPGEYTRVPEAGAQESQ
jgi:hypothetical protein